MAALRFIILSLAAASVLSWQPVVPSVSRPTYTSRSAAYSRKTSLYFFGNDDQADTATLDKPKVEDTSVESTTEKYGLEAGLFESLKKDDGGETAKSLLKKYGIAYLATSIPLAIVSFTICYFLVSAGVDVGALLAKVGIEGDTSEKAGTFAIAYAAHKAASPIRFPPTVLLTPVVAKLIGKEEPEEDEATEAAGDA